MDNQNIFIGPKDPKDSQYYLSLYPQFLIKELKIVKTSFLIIQKYIETGESLSYKCLYFRREYVNQVAQCLSELNFEDLITIPREKGGCAFYIECRYVKSGKMVSMQLVEARVGAGGGYFSVSPAIVLKNEEAEKAYKHLQKIF